MASNRVITTTDELGKTLSPTNSTQRLAQVTEHLTPVSEAEQVNTRPALSISYPISKLRLDPNHYVDDVRQLKVAVIGVSKLENYV